MATQKAWQQHFLQPERRGGGGVWDTLAHSMGIVTLKEFDKNYKFFTTSYVPYIDHILRLKKKHFN
jgi:hypothetical protein